MKKIAAAAFIVIFSLIILAPLNKTNAICVQAPGSGTCNEAAYPNRCPIGNPRGSGVVMCCQTQAECTTSQNAAQNPASTPLDESSCRYVANAAKQQECLACAGVWTAIGCIKTDPNNLLGSLLGLGIGVAGGIAFLLILFGGLQIMTSAGNPERMNAGRELISSAVTGLLLIIFAVFLLRFIGFNIIGIPGFGVQTQVH